MTVCKGLDDSTEDRICSKCAGTIRAGQVHKLEVIRRGTPYYTHATCARCLDPKEAASFYKLTEKLIAARAVLEGR